MDKEVLREVWRDIPGYEGRYQASTHGRIRKAWKGAKQPVILKANPKHSGANQLYVNLFTSDGKQQKRPVLRLVAMAFMKDLPEDAAVVHRNLLHSDNGLMNIRVMSRSALGRKVSYRYRCRPVVMIDRDGEIVECYESASKAAEANYIGLDSVCKRCRGEIKDEFALTGYSFRYDE
jgi:hypothetical protein